MYWLQLMEEFTTSNSLSGLQKERHEIIRILQKIITTLDH